MIYLCFFLQNQAPSHKKNHLQNKCWWTWFIFLVEICSRLITNSHPRTLAPSGHVYRGNLWLVLILFMGSNGQPYPDKLFFIRLTVQGGGGFLDHVKLYSDTSNIHFFLIISPFLTCKNSLVCQFDLSGVFCCYICFCYTCFYEWLCIRLVCFLVNQSAEINVSLLNFFFVCVTSIKPDKGSYYLLCSKASPKTVACVISMTPPCI